MSQLRLISNQGRFLVKQPNLIVLTERLSLCSSQLNLLSKNIQPKMRKNLECITFAKSTYSKSIDILTRLKQNKKTAMNKSFGLIFHENDLNRCELSTARILMFRCRKEWHGLSKFRASWPR
jgi:hypothetical protein